VVSCGAGFRAALHGGPGRDARDRRSGCGLVLDPCPPEGFHRGDTHRLRVGRFRVVYVVDDDLITLERVPGWMTWRDLESTYEGFQHLPLSPCIRDFRVSYIFSCC
jgi:hypothetical protein